MSIKTFHGSCFCKAVKFEVALDLSQGTGKCNCTSCWKRRWWSVRAKVEDFRSLGGEEHLQKERGFCTTCGILPYRKVEAAEWNDGAYYAINVAVLDDLDPKELLAAPVQYYDGRHDNWFQQPEVTAHL
ncbi:MAG TPA: GFA family protein [Polyangiales bacterium]|nr:GFA family protein [Polyangiales bacterium]